MNGKVKTIVLDRGFIFIEVVTTPATATTKAETVDYFAHRSALRDGLRIEDLRQGDDVHFVADPMSRKGPRAEEVRRLDPLARISA